MAFPTGRALDIATGKGANALFLAARGYQVDAVDISEPGLQIGRMEARRRGLTVHFIQADLEHVELAKAAYDVVLNIDFLQRGLIPRLKAAVRQGGHIFFETYLVDQPQVGRPKNPDYLLRHNELLECFREFRVLYYREGRFVDGDRESYRARLLAEKVRKA